MRPTIQNLYIGQNLSKEEVITELASKHDFHVT